VRQGGGLNQEPRLGKYPYNFFDVGKRQAVELASEF
jgi:hypothetical protein